MEYTYRPRAHLYRFLPHSTPLPRPPPLCDPLTHDIQALEGLEEDTGPSYVAQPASLPQEPSLVPESTGPTGVDEYGLPVGPSPATPAQEVRL